MAKPKVESVANGGLLFTDNAAGVSGTDDTMQHTVASTYLAYNAYLGGYLTVHSVGVEPRLRLSLAPQPWGEYRPIGEVGAPHCAFEKAF